MGIEENSEMIFFLINKNLCCDHHKNCLPETVLVMDHNIGFYREI